MSRGGLRAAVALTATALASTAACSFLVPVDGLAGAVASDAALPQDALPQDAPMVDTGTAPPSDASPADGAPDATADGAPASLTLFANASPVSPADPSASPLEVGVRFTVSTPGDVVAVRFFRASSNPSGYVVHLWAPNGVLLATAAVPSDVGKPIGWREQAIAPTRLTPSNVYIASYFSDNGACAFTAHGLASAVKNGPLTAPASGDSGTDGNGVFDYVPNPLTTPPASTFEETNYFVDVQFSPTP
jgi:hypothetical protein